MRLLLALVTAAALTLAAAGSASAAEPLYSFQNRFTGGVLDVPGFSQTPGTRVQDWPGNGGSNQLWTAGATTTVGTVHYSELRAGGFQEGAYYRMIPLSAEGKDLALVVSQWTPGPGQELVLAFKGGETAKPQHFYFRVQ